MLQNQRQILKVQQIDIAFDISKWRRLKTEIQVWDRNDSGDIHRADKSPVIVLAFEKNNIHGLNSDHDICSEYVSVLARNPK